MSIEFHEINHFGWKYIGPCVAMARNTYYFGGERVRFIICIAFWNRCVTIRWTAK